MRGFDTAFAAAMLAAFAAVPHAAQADACDTVMAALVAQAKVPYAAGGTMSMPGQAPMHTDVVVTGGKMYVQVMGKWTSLPFSSEQTIDEARQKMKATSHSCGQAGTEPVNGEAATIYSMHEDNKDGAAESRMWISDGSGLPLKFEIKLPGNAANQTLEYRYGTIDVPAGAK